MQNTCWADELPDELPVVKPVWKIIHVVPVRVIPEPVKYTKKTYAKK